MWPSKEPKGRHDAEAGGGPEIQLDARRRDFPIPDESLERSDDFPPNILEVATLLSRPKHVI